MSPEEISKFIHNFFSQSLTGDLKTDFGQWLIRDNSEKEKMKVLEDIWFDESFSAEADEQTLEELEMLHSRISGSLPKRSVLPHLIRVAAAIALLVTGSFSSYLFLNASKGKEEGDVKMVQCFVPYGEHKSVHLPDGSIAWLNSGSLLVYPAEFRGNIRSMYLSGEAEFTVVKNKKKPFIVKTNHIEVEALGTIFTVTSFPEDSITQTMLEEGKVRVGIYNTRHENRVLHPNQLLTYSNNSERITITTIDAAQSAKWTKGYLIFRDATLSEIIKSMERRNNVNISFDNKRLGGGIYNVKFMPNETVEESLSVLNKLVGGFNYKAVGNTYILTKK